MNTFGNIAKAEKLRVTDTFYCRARRRKLTIGKCLEDYVTANAFDKNKSACWRCPQGKKTRCAFSEG